MSCHDLTLKFTLKSRRQLEDIYLNGILRRGEQQAETYQTRILNVCETLRMNPMLGTRRDDIRAGFRSFPVEQHVVFYRVRGSTLTVHGVLSGRVDVHRMFKPKP